MREERTERKEANEKHGTITRGGGKKLDFRIQHLHFPASPPVRRPPSRASRPRSGYNLPSMHFCTSRAPAHPSIAKPQAGSPFDLWLGLLGGCSCWTPSGSTSAIVRQKFLFHTRGSALRICMCLSQTHARTYVHRHHLSRIRLAAPRVYICSGPPGPEPFAGPPPGGGPGTSPGPGGLGAQAPGGRGGSQAQAQAQAHALACGCRAGLGKDDVHTMTGVFRSCPRPLWGRAPLWGRGGGEAPS